MSEVLDSFGINFVYVLATVLLIGINGGSLGTFALLRKRSLLGDALAHAALPGIVLAFIITGSKHLSILLLGATITGAIGVVFIQLITRQTRLQTDAALGIVLSSFFGLGIVLLTYVQRGDFANQSGLNAFLFGQAAAILPEDLVTIAFVTAVILLFVTLFYKELQGMVFDADYLSSRGFSASLLDFLLMTLITLAVMVGLQAVGVVLMAAMLITPAAAARFWSDRFSVVLSLSIIFGMLAGVSGSLLSLAENRLPTGPLMVVAATILFVFSALFAPRRGIIAAWQRKRNNQRRENSQNILKALFEVPDDRGLDSHRLQAQLMLAAGQTQKHLRYLQRRGQIRQLDDRYLLTASGKREAAFIQKSHLLWEDYLRLQSLLPGDHLHDPAEKMEHILTPEIINQIEAHLQREKRGDQTEAKQSG
jgi:manganese/zinc/iron transport system permease protein